MYKRNKNFNSLSTVNLTDSVDVHGLLLNDLYSKLCVQHVGQGKTVVVAKYIEARSTITQKGV